MPEPQWNTDAEAFSHMPSSELQQRMSKPPCYTTCCRRCTRDSGRNQQCGIGAPFPCVSCEHRRNSPGCKAVAGSFSSQKCQWFKKHRRVLA